jgi:hypothetical protein
MAEEIIVVPGDPYARFTCISSPTRFTPAHAWQRALLHIDHMLEVPFAHRWIARAALIEFLSYLPKYEMPKPPHPFNWNGKI